METLAAIARAVSYTPYNPYSALFKSLQLDIFPMSTENAFCENFQSENEKYFLHVALLPMSLELTKCIILPDCIGTRGK